MANQKMIVFVRCKYRRIRNSECKAISFFIDSIYPEIYFWHIFALNIKINNIEKSLQVYKIYVFYCWLFHFALVLTSMHIIDTLCVCLPTNPFLSSCLFIFVCISVANIVAIPIFVNLNIHRYITLYIFCKSKWAYY